MTVSPQTRTHVIEFESSSTLPKLDVDEMGSVCHCIAALASSAVVAVQGSVELQE
jgi:hypothetical protein